MTSVGTAIATLRTVTSRRLYAKKIKVKYDPALIKRRARLRRRILLVSLLLGVLVTGIYYIIEHTSRAVCGDGKRHSDEQCDDANTEDGDGCSTICSIEDGYQCTTSDQSGSSIDLCQSKCGDGWLVGNEGCDDDNSVGTTMSSVSYAMLTEHAFCRW